MTRREKGDFVRLSSDVFYFADLTAWRRSALAKSPKLRARPADLQLVGYTSQQSTTRRTLVFMFDINTTRHRLVQGDANLAVAEVTVREPALTFRVQLSALDIGGKRMSSVYATCLQHPSLEFTAAYRRRQPGTFNCATELATLLQQPKFCEQAIGPLLARVDKA